MFDIVFTLKRRPGMSRQDFIDYYENTHSQFVRFFVGARYYRRRYVETMPLPSGIADSAAEPPFDVVTEIGFDDLAAYNHAIARLVESGKSEALAEDEKRLFDIGKMVCVTVSKTCETDISKVPFVA